MLFFHCWLLFCRIDSSFEAIQVQLQAKRHQFLERLKEMEARGLEMNEAKLLEEQKLHQRAMNECESLLRCKFDVGVLLALKDVKKIQAAIKSVGGVLRNNMQNALCEFSVKVNHVEELQKAIQQLKMISKVVSVHWR